MSRFFSNKYSALKAYTPGEQPKDQQYIKLNTNESPFAPPESVVRAVTEEAGRLQLYSDPECTPLVAKASEYFGVSKDQVLMTNGSDEILNFAFMAFGKEKGVIFPDITYGFYSVFAALHGLDTKVVPLREDFTVDVDDYCSTGRMVVLANPNAPTGIALSLAEIERIVSSNPDAVVLIDEAYVDFGAQSAIRLTEKYDNLLVVQTFSKSRSMAGARLGYAFASAEIIKDLEKIKYSTNPYNVNRITQAAGVAALSEQGYYDANCQSIMETRAFAKTELEKLGFSVLASSANFLFAKHERVSGKEIYLRLKENGVLVRHFTAPRIEDYNRITIGTREEMVAMLAALNSILERSDL